MPRPHMWVEGFATYEFSDNLNAPSHRGSECEAGAVLARVGWKRLIASAGQGLELAAPNIRGIHIIHLHFVAQTRVAQRGLECRLRSVDFFSKCCLHASEKAALFLPLRYT